MGDLETRLRSMGFNPMYCTKNHDCHGDPHFIVDTKEGRKEVMPRTTHKDVAIEDLGISRTK